MFYRKQHPMLAILVYGVAISAFINCRGSDVFLHNKALCACALKKQTERVRKRESETFRGRNCQLS